MKSHTGGVMSMGIGGIVCKSSEQKLNTKSSTEAELVGASDYLPNTIWMKNFLEAQGHKITEKVLGQDNESAIKLEKNGRILAGPRSQHVDIRFFWIKDRVKDGEIEIRHCPTLQMLANFFTKPLQGALFRKFRDVILGYKHVDSLALTDPVPSFEERVGGCRSDENCTDGPSEDGFITVHVKKARRNRAAWTPEETTVSTCVRMANVVSGRLKSKKVSLFRESFSRNNPASRTEFG
jgi:hypothetical protein